MKLYLIRHPQPDIDAGICYGGADVAAPAERLHAAAATLRPQLPPDAPLYTSPLRRCAALADLLAGGRQIVDNRLRELHFGAWEMRAWDEIPRAEIDAWAENPVAYRPGGGDTVLEMARRVREFYVERLRSGVRDVVVVCHAGTMRLLEACPRHSTVENMAASAASIPRHFSYGELIRLRCEG